MLSGWTELLPLFVLRLIADKKCERVFKGGRTYAIVRPGVLIETSLKPVSGPVVVSLGRA